MTQGKKYLYSGKMKLIINIISYKTLIRINSYRIIFTQNYKDRQTLLFLYGKGHKGTEVCYFTR